MLELLVILIGGSYLLITGDSSTNDCKSSTRKTCKADMYNKYDNMTSYELQKYLLENNLYDIYGGYSRETLINKLVERN